MKKILLGLTILIFASCGNENTNSFDSSNLSQSKFEWDFSKQRKFIYSFSQTVNGENNMGEEKSVFKTFVIGNGKLSVRVKENNLADIGLIDLEMKMVMYDEDGSPKDTMTQKAPPNVIQDMKPDGSFSNSNSDMLFDMIFPLPKKNLNKGDSYDLPMQMPFNAYGSKLFVKGQNTLTFTGFKEVEGYKCAVLEGLIDISQLDIPEDLNGEYESSTIGNASYYFDLQNRFYVGADIAIIMSVMMNPETEGFPRSHVKMKSDNVYKIRLEEIQE